jgi:[ribosomal protein S5]-alanine N-acetyltransferase
MPLQSPLRMRTARLDLLAATLEHVTAELEAPEQLSELLGAAVPASWPPGEYDRDALAFFRERLLAGGADAVGWYGWYALSRPEPGGESRLVGAGGYFGPPGPEGAVEIGYSVVPEHRGEGYAIELAQAIVARAWAFPEITTVVAHTTPGNAASVRVLERCGFTPVGPGEAEGTVRFEATRRLAT